MHVVILAVDPADGNPPLWRDALRAAGASAEVLGSCPAALPAADLVISHVLLVGPQPRHPVFWAARRYEALGTPLLNGTACLRRCADKRRTHRAWAAAGLPQPRWWPLEELAPPARWPRAVLVKPAFGESARGIAVAESHGAAVTLMAGRTAPAFVQEIVACRSVLRVHATGAEVLGAFARPAAAITGLPAPDPNERPVPITPDLHALATAAVRTLGGGLLGLDLVSTPAGPILLEANPAFSVPVHLPELLARIVAAALRLAGRPQGSTAPA